MPDKKRLVDVAGVNPDEYRTFKPDQFLNEDLELLGFRWDEGAFGSYARLMVRSNRYRETIEIMTGSKAVLDALGNLPEDVKFPLSFTFRQSGRRIYVD